MNTEDNRRKRRSKELTGVRNNRSNPTKRNKVRLRMAYFALKFQSMFR